MQVELQPTDQRSTPSADRRSICRSKNYMQIKVRSADKRSIPFASRRTVWRLKNYLQTEELSADRIIIYISNLDWHIKELSVDQSSICK